MKTDITNNDELLLNLPDYVSGEILEPGLKEKIEERIATDKSFYSEYLKIKETFDFMKGIDPDPAPENYFNSLLPRINERIESRKPANNFLHYIFAYWKIAVPALTVILLIFIFNKSDRIEHIEGVPEFQKNVTVFPTDSNLNEQTEKIQSDTEEKIPKPNIVNVRENKQRNVRIEESKSTVNASILGESIFGESEEDESDFYYLDEFQNLSSSEQNDLINNLKNTKF